MPRIVALLSFFDEPDEFIQRLVTSLPTAGVTHLVALDGRYATFPSHLDVSTEAQHDTLVDTCQTTGITLDLHIPAGPWQGDEIHKRTELFNLGERCTTPVDWYLIVDGDEEYTHAPPNIAEHLAHTVFDVGQALMHEHGNTTPFPKYFRAIRGLHCAANHYTYRTPDGRYLWGNAHTTRLQPRQPLDVHLTHHAKQRDLARRTAAALYYNARDNEHTEHHNPMRHAA